MKTAARANLSSKLCLTISSSASKLFLWVTRPDMSQQRKTQIMAVSDFSGMVERRKSFKETFKGHPHMTIEL